MKRAVLNMLATPMLVGAMLMVVGPACAQTEQGAQAITSARRAKATSAAEVPRTRIGGAVGVLEGDNVPGGKQRRQASSPRKSELLPGPAVGDQLPVTGEVRP